MLRTLSFFLILLLLVSAGNLSSAQTVATAESTSGALMDYPSNWNLEDTTGTDFEDAVVFTNESMTALFSIVDAPPLFQAPENILRFFISEIEGQSDDLADFSDMEIYDIDDQWETARAIRVRSDNLLVEVVSLTTINDFSVLMRSSFRIGAQDFFLPIYDDMIASVRSVDDEIVITDGSTAQRPITDGMIGSVLEPLDIGALNTNFITEDQNYQFDYPDSWDMRPEDNGHFTLIERNAANSVLFGQLTIAPSNSDSTTESLVQGQFEETVDVSAFLLNDLPASRIVIEDEANNVRRVVMAAIRDEIQAVIDVTTSLETPEQTDAILRAILYSVRANGEPFVLSISGEAVRTGLLSAEIYGTANIASQQIVVDDIVLDTRYVTRNARFTFNHPSEWFVQVIERFIVITNDDADEIELYAPSRNDVQLILTFIEDTRFFEDVSSAETVLSEFIANDSFQSAWSDIVTFDSVGRSAAYADFSFSGLDSIERFYLIELDDIDNVFVLAQMILEEDDLDEYDPIIRVILDTIRFQD